MKIRNIIQIAAALTLIAVIAAAPGCIFDPKEAVDDDPPPVVEWPDRTNKEDCITIIKRVYDERKIEKYKELLLKPDVLLQEPEFADGYIWYNQPDDVSQYGPSLTYDDDWNGTEGILENAVTMNISIFSSYPPGTTGVWDGYWEKIPDIRSVAGPNFWQTRRNYDFYFDFGEDKYTGDFDVIFVIGPDPADPNKYVIYQATDVPKQ